MVLGPAANNSSDPERPLSSSGLTIGGSLTTSSYGGTQDAGSVFIFNNTYNTVTAGQLILNGDNALRLDSGNLIRLGSGGTVQLIGGTATSNITQP